jgi:hypothetical protein
VNVSGIGGRPGRRSSRRFAVEAADRGISAVRPPTGEETMTIRRVALGTVLAVACVAGCSDKYERHTAREVELFQELNAILRSVESESGIDLAVAKLEALAPKFKLWAERQEMIGAPPEDRKREIREEYGDKLQREKTLFGTHIQRLQAIDGSDRLLKAVPPEINPE